MSKIEAKQLGAADVPNSLQTLSASETPVGESRRTQTPPAGGPLAGLPVRGNEPRSVSTIRSASHESVRRNENAEPIIKNKEALYRFIVGGKPFGNVREISPSLLTSERNRLFDYSGLVFRGDSRPPWEIMRAGGFHSKNDLSDPKHMLEAQGLAQGKGATGQSGVSTSKNIEGALPYCNWGNTDGSGHIYVIDTRRLSSTDHAYDMADIMIKNGYKDWDESGGEVNVTDVPVSAIAGWLSMEDADPIIDDPDSLGGIPNVQDKIQLNRRYGDDVS